MKLHHSLLAAALLAGVSTSAAAQSSTGVVSLSGTIVPSSCALTLDNGGTVDLGQIDASTLAQSGLTAQPSVNVGLEIDCTAPTLLALTLYDNKHGTAAQSFNNRLGLGLTTTGKPIGQVGIAPMDPTVDTVASNLIGSTNLAGWVNAGVSWWDKKNSGSNIYRAFGTTTGGAVPLTEATLNLRVDAFLNSRSALQLTQAETVDGSATIEVFYF